MPTYMHGDSISMIYVSESQHGHAEELISVQNYLLVEYSPSQYHSCWLCQCLQQPPNLRRHSVPPLPRFRLGPHGHLGTIIQIQISTGADPGFEKGGGAGGSGARPQDFFGQFRGFFKVFGAKRVGRAPPAPLPPLVPRLLQAIRHELQLTIATQTCQQESSTTKEMMTGIP